MSTEASVAKLSELDQVLLRLVHNKAVADAVKAADQEARAEAARLLKKGDTLTCWSPLDPTKRLSRTSMSNPKPVATVTDAAALDEWIRERYPEKLRTEKVITGTDAEVIAVLEQHAPHLLAKRTTVPGWLVNEIVTLSKGAGQPVGPGGETGEDAPRGITVSLPDGVLSVTLDKVDGPAEFRRLWDAHLFGMDGTVIQLPGGDHDFEGA